MSQSPPPAPFPSPVPRAEPPEPRELQEFDEKMAQARTLPAQVLVLTEHQRAMTEQQIVRGNRIMDEIARLTGLLSNSEAAHVDFALENSRLRRQVVRRLRRVEEAIEKHAEQLGALIEHTREQARSFGLVAAELGKLNTSLEAERATRARQDSVHEEKIEVLDKEQRQIVLSRGQVAGAGSGAALIGAALGALLRYLLQ